jgi:hypothetical protein
MKTFSTKRAMNCDQKPRFLFNYLFIVSISHNVIDHQSPDLKTFQRGFRK